MPSPGVRIRPASREDAAAVMAMLHAGFETFRDWAPAGWEQPPLDAGTVMATEAILGRPGTWYVVAEDAAGHAGQCGIHPAHEGRLMKGPAVVGMAHFWHLFVRRDLWGTGLAAELHDLAVRAMRERGYERARLVTPAGQARARRFYEGRGWVLLDHPVDVGPLGLDLVEYRLELGQGRRPPPS